MLSSSSSASWRNIESANTTSIEAFVQDDTSSASGSLSILKAAFLFNSTNPPRNVEMTVLRNSGTTNATANYWGVFPDVPSRVQEVEAGTVDFSRFKSTEIPGTGPQ